MKNLASVAKACLTCGFHPSLLGCGKSECAAGEGWFPQSHYPEKPGVGVADDVGKMNEKHEQENHDPGKCGGKPRVCSGGYAQGCGNEASAHEERPEHVPGKPRRDHPRQDRGCREVFSAKHCQRNGKKDRTKYDDLIQTSLLEKLVPDGDQADSQNQGADEVG